MIWHARRCACGEGCGCAEPRLQGGEGSEIACRPEPIIITKPGRILSYDETRIEMDMTKGSKAKKKRTIVDRTVPQEEWKETLTFKGGVFGTGVGGSTAAGDTFPALFIIAGAGISPEMCSPSPNCEFYGTKWQDAAGKVHL
mmetsp:Transcript_13173/g.28416  ORF Transcript_13173/g.28416 Transcript_13173/m.28416 type:complete len:142 (+) Transcript_13173:683-1108(+)